MAIPLTDPFLAPFRPSQRALSEAVLPRATNEDLGVSNPRWRIREAYLHCRPWEHLVVPPQIKEGMGRFEWGHRVEPRRNTFDVYPFAAGRE